LGSAIIITLLGLAYFLLSLQYELGTLKRPGPGALPVLLGLGLIIVGLALGVNSFRDRKKANPGSRAEQTIRPAVLVSVALIGYALLWPLLGTILNTILLFLLLCKLMGGEGWVTPVVVSLVSAVGLFWAFGVLLDVPFPEGIGFIERLLK
jgi:putative tricarboxylic transport membrane protein